MPAASASRKSFTALPALSDREALAARSAGLVAFDAVCEARLRAFCCRPRASPPFLAAARRLLAEALCEPLEDEPRERLEDDFVDRLEELLVDRLEELLVDRLEELRGEADPLRELDADRDEPDFRAAPPPLLLEELLRV